MEKIGRRDFLKILGVGMFLVSVPESRRLVKTKTEEDGLDWLENPTDYRFIRRKINLGGTAGGIANTAFLWQRESEVRAPYIRQAREVARHARIFIDDKFEENLGQYNENVLPQIAAYAEELRQNELGLQVDLIDAYPMKDSWNLVFGGHKRSSPYAADGEDNFYKLEKYQEAYLKRVNKICRELRKIPNLTAITLGNELRPPRGQDGEEIFRKWFERMAGEVKNMVPEVNIVSGVADPRYLEHKIKGLDINTVHFYENFTSFWGLKEYLAESETPIMVQEWGVPSSILGINYHSDLDGDRLNFFRKILKTSSQLDPKNKTVRINIIGTGVWGFNVHNDGYNFDTEKMPKTTREIKRFNLIKY